MAKKPHPKKKPSYEDLGKMLTNIYESGYLDYNQAYKMAFLKGMVTGLGGVIGATVVVALLIWVLSLFDSLPLVGNIAEAFKNAMDSK